MKQHRHRSSHCVWWQEKCPVVLSRSISLTACQLRLCENGGVPDPGELLVAVAVLCQSVFCRPANRDVVGVACVSRGFRLKSRVAFSFLELVCIYIYVAVK